jgi:hypothetical protein
MLDDAVPVSYRSICAFERQSIWAHCVLEPRYKCGVIASVAVKEHIVVLPVVPALEMVMAERSEHQQDVQEEHCAEEERRRAQEPRGVP